jgi:transaldolase|nr:MAG: transaldolase [Actinomycetota bacterium]
MRSNLHGLAAAGVSVWSDQISRAMLDTGELARRIEEDAVSGVTSNPTIFANAIVGSSEYEGQKEALRRDGLDPEGIVRELMAEDIERACDVLLPVWKATGGDDGYVSVEVSPVLATDTQATIEEARMWVETIARPNLLVKVPATREGIPAIRALTAEGISVNVTLIFSLQRYAEVIDAYMSGLEDLIAGGGEPRGVFSVASFFVSRFDTEVDRRLEAIGTDEARSLLGKTAVANARAAYGLYLERFASDRFDALASKGARRQKPLWASTSTKNPAYHDLLYVETLVAPGTVNTMPLETIEAYQDHGNPEPPAFTDEDVAAARADLDRLGALGIDYDDVVDTLEREGVEKFEKSWRELLAAVGS